MKEKLAAHQTLIEALKCASKADLFATMWQPENEPSEQTVTFGEFFDLAESYAALYQARGLVKGDTIILVLPQGIDLLAAFVGALILGAVPTILAYPTFKVEPAKYRFGLLGVSRNLRARLTVIDKDFPDSLADCVQGIETVVLDSASLPANHSKFSWAEPQPDDIAFIQHSAGTTGLQKGVALSHRAVLNQLVRLSEALRLQSEDRIISWLPLYHDMGLIACFILPLVAHLHVVMQSPTDWVLWPASFLRLISEYRGTLCWLPNFSYQFMARRVSEDDRQGLDLTSLRAAINCSEPIRAHSMEEFYRAYRPYGLARAALQSSYAMAENTFAVTQSVLDGRAPLTVYVDRETVGGSQPLTMVDSDHPGAQSFVSSGLCLEQHRIRIVDDDGRDLPDATVGEVLIQSDSLFSGYYNRPDLTEEALRAGWYWTKDRGFKIGKDLFVLGRKDDLIIIGGKNIYPIDIEEIVWTDPHIREGRVVAFGVENPDLGTQELFIVAEVAEESDLELSQSIQRAIRKNISNEIGIAPRIVELVPPKWIVKSTAGKPARSTTREKFFIQFPELDLNRSKQEGFADGR
ncbi:MAG TPA: AMP-binding protein [Pyrinomonadaceae bacterium]|nr:AMP-binding protein [Pyrinomonadaceae bacterium]